MKPFLQQTAEYIYSKHSDNFENIALIFPNHRSGVFFTEHLKKINNKTIWLPKIVTISDFMQEESSLWLADPIELLSRLYKVFIKVTKSNESFDDFYFWGDMMLRDFNDVDKFMIDASLIFKNVRTLKNIDLGFDFLTESQKEILQRFFNEFDPEKTTKLKEQFLEIWNYLLPIYTEFKTNLEKEQKAYEGMIYSEAVKNIEQKDIDNKQYFFIGFNAITPCEERIFTLLKNRKQAKFFWDYDQYYINQPIFEAGYFMRQQLSNFMPPADFKLEDNNLTKPKNIKIISTSTQTGQVHYLGNWLNSNKQTDYTRTAIILADEQMLEPTLNYLPEDIVDINITMGYPTKETLVGSFVNTIINLHINEKQNNNTFYYKNVISVLRHPYINAIIPDDANTLADKIHKEFIFNISTDLIPDNNELLKLIFSKPQTFSSFADYLTEIFSAVQQNLLAFTEQDMFQLDFEQLYNFNLTVTKLKNQLVEHGIDVSLPIFFRLVKKVLAGLKIPFEGEPVKGLQIMGFLETRNLDFENIIILSANDDYLPANSVSPSFIPYSIRQEFGMPTPKQNDAIYAYYFYRLMQRAKNISFVYNSASVGMCTGTKSRFLQQLLFNDEFKIQKEEQSYKININIPEPISIPKEGIVKERLQEFLAPNSTRTLSPSAITTYMRCPIQFYYQYILNLREPDEITETVDARLFGNIFHNSAELLYKPYEDSNKIITQNTLNKLANDDKLIDNAINQAFAISFSEHKNIKPFNIQGKNLLVKNVIKKYLLQMLHIDSTIAPFNIIGLEKRVKHKFSFEVNNEKHNINIGGIIDRLDQVGDRLRVIDYKTGSDFLKFDKIEDIFNPELISKHKAILQTIIYSLICSELYPEKLKITPGVYKTKYFFTKPFTWQIKSSKKDIFIDSNILPIKDILTEHLQNILSEIFNFDIPFAHTEDTKDCPYCIL